MLDGLPISTIFSLPNREQFADMSVENAIFNFIDNKDLCLNNIVRYWFKVPRRGKSQFPKNLFRSHFNEDISNIITLLHRVMGSKETNTFEYWTCWFIIIIG